MTGFAAGGPPLWAPTRAVIGGNWFGLREERHHREANGTAVSVTGRTQDGARQDPAIGNVIGGPSSATDSWPPACGTYCNVIVNSLDAGIDLVGTPSRQWSSRRPGRRHRRAPEGTTIAGNWIGVSERRRARRVAERTAIRIGDAQDTDDRR